jgi:hypothetical protein
MPCVLEPLAFFLLGLVAENLTPGPEGERPVKASIWILEEQGPHAFDVSSLKEYLV